MNFRAIALGAAVCSLALFSSCSLFKKTNGTDGGTVTDGGASKDGGTGGGTGGGSGANCAAQGKCTKSDGSCGDPCSVGCCLPNDAQGRCQTAVSDSACGKLGATCAACTGGSKCAAAQGGSACGSGGTGGGTGGSDAGQQVMADGVVGTACTQDSQCGTNDADTCWAETMPLKDGGTYYTGFKDGYCQASCADMYDFSSGKAAIRPGYEKYCGNTGYCLLFSQTEGYCYEMCVNATQTEVGTTSGKGTCRDNYVCWGFGSLYSDLTDPNALKLGICAGDCRTIENDPVAKAAHGGSSCGAGFTCDMNGPNAGFCCKPSDGGVECEAYL